MKHWEDSGMSYEQASRKADQLAKTNWYQNLDRLAALKEIMDRDGGTVLHPTT